MIAPRTNWEKTDYFNIIDWSRITSNLNEVASSLSLDTVSFETKSSYADLYYLDEAEAITTLYNKIVTLFYNELPLIKASRQTWFNWTELNKIESLSLINPDERFRRYGQNNSYGDGLVYGGIHLG